MWAEDRYSDLEIKILRERFHTLLNHVKIYGQFMVLRSICFPRRAAERRSIAKLDGRANSRPWSIKNTLRIDDSTVTHRLSSARHVLSLPVNVIGDGGRLFSRTIDPFGETFAINELLPVADIVQLPPADAFPQVPARFVRSWELRPWAKPWGREGGNERGNVCYRFGKPLLRSESEENTRLYVLTRGICRRSTLYSVCIMLTLRARARE